MPILPAFTVVDETTLTIHSTEFSQLCAREWQALLGWCRLHGLDPYRMPVERQTIVRDLERCRVAYDEFVMTLEEMRDRAVRWRDYDGLPPQHRVHAQGETPPMPFPDVILAHLRPTTERNSIDPTPHQTGA